jgi:diguanylate cyclase (GGDEF)-like protein/PAS domain S-box-containing protein
LLRDAQGRVIRAVGGMVDVTQRNRDEVDLRLLRRAVESADNGIVVADARLPGLPAVFVNPAFERISGYAAHELLGSGFHFLDDPDEAARPEAQVVLRAIAEQREARVLLRDRRKDGEAFWNDFHLAPVRDEAGTLTHFVSIQSDVTERQRAQEQLAFRATHDELTGLPNRQLLFDRLQQALLNAEKYGRSIAVLFIDVDEFKLINDSLGHSAGDETLRAVARRLEAAVGETDSVGRFGGDEFVVVLTGKTDDADVAEAIAAVNAALVRPFEIAGITHYLSASIGWCRSPQAGTTAEAMLMHADLAMYKAKHAGRNCVVAYVPEFDTQVSARLHLISELRLALEREEFVLAFQPLFGMDGAPAALEVLVRWRHPERGLLLPGHFINVCEESGLIVPLGRWVLHEAARHYADVAAVFRAHALPRGILELELTESVIMGNPDAAIEVMRRLDAMGVTISVDDFGTGYSSLAYLKRLPIDRLKIDRTFVRDLASDEDDAAICTSIIRLAHSLGLRTVAEGVETREQLAWLCERGCDEVQGFLLARPELFENLLDAMVAKAAGWRSLIKGCGADAACSP